MEEFPPVDANTDSEPVESSKKRRRFFGESGWLSELLRKPTEAKADEEEEATEAPFSSKGKSLLKRLFGSWVEREALGPKPDQNSQEQPPSAEADSSILRISHESEDLTSPVAKAAEHTETTASEVVAPTAPHSEQESNPGKGMPNPRPEVLEQNPDMTVVMPAMQRQDTLPRHVDRQPSQPVIIERTSGVGGLLALEYIGRKRADRKIKKAAAELKKQVIKNEDTQQKRFEELARQSKEQSALLQERRGQYETVAVPVPRTPETRPITAAEVKRLAERPSPIIEREKLNPLTQEIHYTNPEQVLKEVREAADKDAAIEKIYERRQEVKDDQSTGPGVASIGSVLQQSLSAHGGLSVAERKDLARAAQHSHRQYEKAQQNMYQQAIISGFATAVVLLATVAAFVFLQR